MALPASLGTLNVYEAAMRYRAALLDREQSTVDDFVRRWTAAQVEIERELDTLVRRIEKAVADGKHPTIRPFGENYGPDEFSASWLYQAGRFDLLAETIQQEVNAFTDASKKQTRKRVEIETGNGAANALKLLTFATHGAYSPTQFSRLPSKALDQITAFVGKDGPKPIAFRGLSDDLNYAVQQQLVNGLAQGVNPRIMARKMQADIMDGGILDRPLYEQMRVARTEPLRAYREATRQTYQANDDVVEEWEWSCHPGARTCPYCLAMDGRRFPLDVIFASHPQCRCSHLPVTELSDPVEWRGRAFLNSLSPEEQDVVFGSHTMGELFRKGKFTLDDIPEQYVHPKWGGSGRAASMATLRERGVITQADIEGARNSHTPSGGVPPVQPVAGRGMLLPNYQEGYKPPAKKPTRTPSPKPGDKEFIGPTEFHGPPAPPPAPARADVILHQQEGGQAGSNAGGFYRGTDGVLRYVKFYKEEGQALSELAANEVYRALGIKAPNSETFQHNGQTVFASEVMDVEGTIKNLGLTKKDAKEILKGFAADVLTANWDAVGTGLDNVVRLKGGGIARIDQGGAFLYRAQGAPKPTSILNQIGEWESFAPGGVSSYYARVFKEAGLDAANELASGGYDQITAILKLRDKSGGWKAFVRNIADASANPKWDGWDRITEMLEERTKLLDAKRTELGKEIRASRKAGQARKASATGAKFVLDLDGDAAQNTAYNQLRAAMNSDHYGAKRTRLQWHIDAGGDATAWDELTNTVITDWTYSYKDGTQQRRMYRAAKAILSEKGGGTLAKRIVNIMRTRKERWAKAMEAMGLGTEAPTHFKIYRGARGEEMVRHVLEYWADDRHVTMPAKTYETASWSFRRGRPGKGEAADEFYGHHRNAVMFVAPEVPIANTFADQIVDDSSFLTSFYSEQEILPLYSEHNAVPCDPRQMTVRIDGREYTWSERAQALAAFEKEFGYPISPAPVP